MHRDLDGMLELLIETVLEHGREDATLPLVLHLGGVVVAGTAIPSSAYYQQAGATFRVSGHNLAAVFQELAALDRDREAEKERLEEELDRATEGGRALSREEHERFAHDFEEAETAYLHLKDARLYAGGAPLRLPLWRARLSDVSGWSIGQPEDAPA